VNVSSISLVNNSPSVLVLRGLVYKAYNGTCLLWSELQPRGSVDDLGLVDRALERSLLSARLVLLRL
jgi:hypothetical protein